MAGQEGARDEVIVEQTPQPPADPTPSADPAPAAGQNPGWSSPPPPPSGGPPMAPTGGIAPPVLPPKRARSPLRQFSGIIVIVVVALIVVGVGFLFRDRITGDAGSLKVGDCFDLPADASASATVGDVQHHPCTEAHGGEVFAVLTYPADATATYPAPDAFDAFAADQCSTSFQTYTGTAFDAATNFDAGYFFPLDTGWSSGDRTVICYLEDAAGQSLTHSMRSPAP